MTMMTVLPRGKEQYTVQSSEETYQQTWSNEGAPPCQAHLRTYTGTIQTLGKIEVEVSVNNQTEQLSLEVAKGSGPSLLGIDW